MKIVVLNGQRRWKERWKLHNLSTSTKILYNRWYELCCYTVKINSAEDTSKHNLIELRNVIDDEMTDMSALGNTGRERLIVMPQSAYLALLVWLFSSFMPTTFNLPLQMPKWANSVALQTTI